MKFIHRLAYYLGGFSLGIVILAFFLSGKKTSCNYFPDARVLESIKSKELLYSEAALQDMAEFSVDSIAISRVLEDGDVDFGKSNTDLDSCNVYFISHQVQSERTLELLMQNCDSTATVLNIAAKE